MNNALHSLVLCSSIVSSPFVTQRSFIGINIHLNRFFGSFVKSLSNVNLHYSRFRSFLETPIVVTRYIDGMNIKNKQTVYTSNYVSVSFTIFENCYSSTISGGAISINNALCECNINDVVFKNCSSSANTKYPQRGDSLSGGAYLIIGKKTFLSRVCILRCFAHNWGPITYTYSTERLEQNLTSICHCNTITQGFVNDNGYQLAIENNVTRNTISSTMASFLPSITGLFFRFILHKDNSIHNEIAHGQQEARVHYCSFINNSINNYFVYEYDTITITECMFSKNNKLSVYLRNSYSVVLFSKCTYDVSNPQSATTLSCSFVLNPPTLIMTPNTFCEHFYNITSNNYPHHNQFVQYVFLFILY